MTDLCSLGPREENNLEARALGSDLFPVWTQLNETQWDIWQLDPLAVFQEIRIVFVVALFECKDEIPRISGIEHLCPFGSVAQLHYCRSR